MVLTAALEGLYYGMFAGVAVTFVQSFAQGRIGRATSMYMNGLFLGGTLGSVSMGFIATWHSYQVAVLFASACAVAAIVLLYLTKNMDQYVEELGLKK